MLRAISHQNPRIELCILAGGRSERMGRDKALLRIGGRTLLAMIRETAASTGLRVRVIRRDAVPRCGPLGGIITGFRRSRAEALLFLACDMPFVTGALLQRVVRSSQEGIRAVFATTNKGNGFPFLLPREALPTVEERRRRQEFSLQKLCAVLNGTTHRVAAKFVFNINTPADLESAEKARIRLGLRSRKDARSSRNRNPSS